MVQVWHDARMEDHQPGEGHPERPARLVAAANALRGHPSVEWRAVTPATEAELGLAHAPAYVRGVLETAGRAWVFDEDTATSPGSVLAATLAAGAVLGATRAVWDGPDRRAIALVRPPGHHAERDRAMGFCLFNNVAVAAADRLAAGARRVLIVDWDVHHGNGTQHTFAADPRVRFFSTHQGFGFYPGTGAAHETGAGNVRNVPLRPRDGHEALVDAFERTLVPWADAFAPELVLVSAGFDAHRDDPLGGLVATEATFGALTAIVRGIADRHAGGRLVLALEGGYALDAIASSVRACVDALAAEP